MIVFLLPSLLFRLHRSFFDVIFNLFSILHSLFSILHSPLSITWSCSILHCLFSFSILHPSLSILFIPYLHSIFSLLNLHSPFLILHSPLSILHSPFSVLQFPFFHSLINIPPTLSCFLPENDTYVDCAGDVSRKCYTAAKKNWDHRDDVLRVFRTLINCYDEETKTCDAPIAQHINTAIQAFRKHLQEKRGLLGAMIKKIDH